jgi:hypothetical protein
MCLVANGRASDSAKESVRCRVALEEHEKRNLIRESEPRVAAV